MGLPRANFQSIYTLLSAIFSFLRNLCGISLLENISYIMSYQEVEVEVSFIKSITLCSPWTELRVLLQFINIFKLYILQD